MQHHSETATQSTVFDNLGTVKHNVASLARMMTVAEWWTEFDEPVEYLEDPEATFEEDARCLVGVCAAGGIAYHRTEKGLAFPVWMLRELYPENP